MGTKDKIARRLEQLREIHETPGSDPLIDEAIDEIFHLAECLLAERDVLWGLLHKMLAEQVDQRVWAVMAETVRQRG